MQDSFDHIADQVEGRVESDADILYQGFDECVEAGRDGFGIHVDHPA